jgi:hypothetical protein
MLLISAKIIYFDYLHDILIFNLETLTRYILPMPRNILLEFLCDLFSNNINIFYGISSQLERRHISYVYFAIIV